MTIEVLPIPNSRHLIYPGTSLLPMKPRVPRRVPFWLVAMAGGVLGTAPWAVWPARLPDPVAFHWTPEGPDSTVSRGAATAIFLIVVPAVAFLVFLAHQRNWRPGNYTPAVGTGVLGFAAFTSVSVFLVNFRANDWRGAEFQPWDLLLIALGALAFAALGFFVRPPERRGGDSKLQTLERDDLDAVKQ